MILVDSNVLLDIFTEDSVWFEWSSSTLQDLCEFHRLAINAIIYAEVSIRFLEIEELDKALPTTYFERLPLTEETAFLAGKCFLKYRQQGGQKVFTLPDFFIGAHAAVLKIPLMTRDIKRYKTYFPTVELICPTKETVS